jgi:hypothetical protein
MISLLRKNKTIVEYYPTNPDTIIIKNQFYPKGLTELDIYNYYIKNKNSILKQVEDRELMFFLGLENGNTVVKRKTPEGKYIILNNGNYKDLITGRTVSIHSTMKQKENFGIVDIDSTDFRKSKLATINVYDYLKSIPEIKNVQIRYTGKDSFHLICTLNKILAINDIRSYFKTILSQRFTKEYEIAYHKKLGSKVNLDLSSNKYRGGFITLGSLSVLGLKCMKLSKGQLKNFNKEQAKIK